MTLTYRKLTIEIPDDMRLEIDGNNVRVLPKSVDVQITVQTGSFAEVYPGILSTSVVTVSGHNVTSIKKL